MDPRDPSPARPATRGRPSKSDAVLLRARIRATALKTFREHGYAGTSIDAIARAAGVSRTTIYALYSDKQTLFTDMIRASVHTRNIFASIMMDDRAPAIVLREAMVALNRAYFENASMEVVRLCIAEADRFPDLMELVRGRLVLSLDQLSAYFARLRAQGRMHIDDCTAAALLFNMLALGSLKPFFVHQARMSEEEATGHIDLALRIFMHGCFSGAGAPPCVPPAARA